MLIEAQNITKAFLDDVVLRDVSLAVREGDRIGLLGLNGAGKTTLLNILEGSLAPDEGRVIRARGLVVGYLRQNDALDTTRTLEEEIYSAFAAVHRVGEAMQACADALKQRPEDKALLAEYDGLAARFEAMEGYRTQEKANRVLNGLGFGGVDRATPVNTLSGGEKMRFAFARLLLNAPDVMLLDEPTNHLDFEMLAWLEGYLKEYRGAVLVVSHDRYFLDAVAGDICELERGRLSRYPGGYTSFVAQKADRLKTAWRAYDKQQEEIAKMEDYVRRNIVRASTSNMAKSRQKALERMERLERPPTGDKSISLRFDYDVEPFATVLSCEGLGVSVGQGSGKRQLYQGLQLEVRRGEKLALVGLNGVGKTTFLKAVQDAVPHEGTVCWGGNVRLGYFDQELAGLPMDLPVLEAVHSRYPAKTEFEIRTALGRLLIEGEAVFKKVRQLSGAQRAKVAFAILQMRRANVLLLDEPTNHLDYGAKEVLEEALCRFTGTLLVVSHDRYFLQRVPSAILEMHPGGFTRYEGNYDVYRQQRHAVKEPEPAGRPAEVQGTAGAAPQPTPPGGGGRRSKAQRARDAQRRQRTGQLESQIAELEAGIALAQQQMAAPENTSDYALLAQLSEALERDLRQLAGLEEEWLALTEETDEAPL